MKKVVLIALCILFLTSAAWAQQYATKTSSGLVTTGTGLYKGIKVVTDGTNAQTIVVYDNTAASGTAIDPSTVYTTSATKRVEAFTFTPRRYYTGLYVSITGSGTVSVTIDFTPE